MLRFAAATMIAAFVWLAADRYAGQLFFAFGSQMGANYAYRVFGWACMCAAVFIATPTPRRWPTVLVCGLVLAVALNETALIIMMTVANGASLVVHWIETLLAFALPAWLIWLWYRSAMLRDDRAPPSSFRGAL